MAQSFIRRIAFFHLPEDINMSERNYQSKTVSNIDQSVAYLQHAFKRVTLPLGFKNHKGTRLHQYQVDFMWIMNEITHPRCVTHLIQDHLKKANKFLAEIEEEIKRK